MQNQPIELTVEQRLELGLFASRVEEMSRKECQQRLVAVYEEILKQENLYKQEIKTKWGIQ